MTEPDAHDFAHINVDRPFEVLYWAHQLGVEEAELKEALALVGDRLHEVRNFLKHDRRYEVNYDQRSQR